MRAPRLLSHVLLPLLAAVLLACCHGRDESAQPGGSSPVDAVHTSLELLKAGNFNGLWKHVLPPEEYAYLRSDWNRRPPDPSPGAGERARFDQAMQQLTAPDAAATLYARWQPKLAALERRYGDQVPILVSIGEAMSKRAVAQNPRLSPARKEQADEVLDALLPWAQGAPWFDPVRARQAIEVAVATARKLDLHSLEQAQALDFDASMDKYAIGYRGLKQVLAIYGLPLDATLDSARLSEVSRDQDQALVRIDYTLLGKPLSTEVRLLCLDGRWYIQDLVENVRQSHQRLARPAASGSAPTTPAAARTE